MQIDTIAKLLQESIKTRLEATETLKECEKKLDGMWRQCGCGEPLFQHVDGSWQCPACEQF